MKVIKNIGLMASIAVVTLFINTPLVFAAAGVTPMNNYCITPPFIMSQVPPEVLFTVGKDHKMYNPAYNDTSDISGPGGEDAQDGILETGYKHAIDYYGYFDSNKCYSYTSGVFVPYAQTTTKYCEGSNAGKWSGNFLNWVAMSRADIIKMVIYGGYRTDDNMGTHYAEISGEYLPQDAHIWGKEYYGSDATKLFPDAVSGKRALFCVKGTTANGKKISMINVIPNVDNVVAGATAGKTLRAWSWINVDGNTDICSDSKIDTNNDGVAETPGTNASSKLNGLQQYNVSVHVCDPDLGFMGNDWETAHCKFYGDNARPVGLMQLYGEAGSGGKVCSKDLYTSCTNDNTCSSASPSKGQCVDKSQMYFGLMMGSFQNPQAGGYLRKDIWSILNETNQQNGILQTSDPDGKGLIMKSIEELKCPTTYPLSSHWGNPIGEILYESMRFWAGKGTPTSDFVSGISGGSNGDNGYFASKPDWEQPGALFPTCSMPFVLIFSDSYNSFDDDQLPGSVFNSFTGDLTDLNVNTLANTIAANEGLTSGTAMIGQVGTTAGAADIGACTGKSITGLGNIRGLCPAEGDLRGSYYAAAVAYYGHTMMKAKYPTTPNVSTYVVSFNSVTPELPIKAGGNKAIIVPYGKSNNGCSDAATLSGTGATLTSTTPSRGLILTPTGTVSTCNTLQTTSFYIMGTPNDDPYNPVDPDSPHYDASNNLTYIKYRWASDDIGSGDFDLDMLEEYEICSGSNSVKCKDYSGADLTLTSDQIAVTVKGVKAAVGNAAALGFIISGTGSTDGAYLPVRKLDAGSTNTPNTGTWAGVPENRTIVFTVTGSGGALLKDPLWYTAKYGGFKDMDGDGLPFTDYTCDPKTRGASARNPKCNEWVSDSNSGDPDNYFLISNPRQVESKLRDALDNILNKTASGTAASILSNNDNNGAMLLQAIFYPRKIINSKTLSWIGELHGLWYHIDPFLQTNSIREDTDGTVGGSSHILNLKTDYRTLFYFDATQSETVVQRLQDVNGNQTVYNNFGSPIAPDDVNSIWRAGDSLWSRDISTSPRALYTAPTSGTTPLSFDTTNVATLQPWLNASTTTIANTIINFIKGTDQTATGYNRNRGATINGADGTWRLGDIVSSTPRLQSAVPSNLYAQSRPTGYNDGSYSTFTSSSNYKNRNMAYVGANDGILHAFNLGKLSKVVPDPDPSHNAHFNVSRVDDTNGGGLGKEVWGFIPKNSLPYLQYLADPTYNHLYYVNGTPSLNDVAINPVSSVAHPCTDTSKYWLCDKVATLNADTSLDLTNTSWRSVLIVGMGLGGASRDSTGSCASSSSGFPNCVKTPITGLGYSSYTALDVTDPLNPKYMWEFSDPTLGYATAGPVIARIGDGSHNGRWFAVFASGPTGPINTTTHQFMGASDQNLRLFIVDVKTGVLLSTINTNIANAFAGSMSNATADLDRANGSVPGNYNDDAIYVGYVRKDDDTGTWTKGGVLRIVTKENNDTLQANFGRPDQWASSTVIDGTGPVTGAVVRLQEDPSHFMGNAGKFWLYFGTGRYFYKSGTDIDDTLSQQSLYGIKEPCYQNGDIVPSCTTTVLRTDLQDQTTFATSSVDGQGNLIDTTKSGWVIDLAAAGTGAAQRVITDPVSVSNGLVYFTAFKPSTDICSFGGSTSLWAVTYGGGGTPRASQLVGQAIIQESTGSFQEIQLSSAFINSQGRESAPYVGVPPLSSPAIFTNADFKPQRKILSIQEN